MDDVSCLSRRSLVKGGRIGRRVVDHQDSGNQLRGDCRETVKRLYQEIQQRTAAAKGAGRASGHGHDLTHDERFWHDARRRGFDGAPLSPPQEEVRSHIVV